MRLGYLHFPRFPVQRRVRETPSLAGKPVVLWADERGAQRVCFASSAALKERVRPGQTVASAAALVPDLARLPYDPAAEARALGTLGESLMTLAPGFQIDPPEGLWLDASAAHLRGGEGPWLTHALALCQEHGWVGRGVVGSERFTTQALARWGQAPPLNVPAGGQPWLSALPVHALARPLGPGGVAPYLGLGLTTLGEVAALPAGAVTARFGHAGTRAAQLARGADDSVFTADALPEVLHEAITLDWPAEALEPLLFALKTAIDRLCARMQGRRRAAVRLTVVLALERMGGRGDSAIVGLVLARPSSQSRLLVELIRHRLTDLTVRQPIAGLAITIDESCADDGRQLNLGDAPAGEAALEVVLSRLQSALGAEALFGVELVDSHRPEGAWKERRFSVADAPARALGWWESAQQEAKAAPPPAEPFVLERPARLLRAPAPLPAEVAADGALTSLELLGRKRRVTAVFGPERLAGEWWTEHPYARDYYRVVLEGVGPLWVFRDGRDGRFYAQGVFD